MPWNDKYWDMIGNLYWTPRFLGLKSIPQKSWQVNGEWISIPRDRIGTSNGPLYIRTRKLADLKLYLSGQEEVLNHFFNLAFSIMPDQVIARLLCRPLSIEENGPFHSLGRDLALRYGWKPSENVTQPDGFFLTERSLIAVELKLSSTSWPEQLAKYLALMLWEEQKSGPRENLGLLFIIPEPALESHWETLNLQTPRLDSEVVAQFDHDRLPDRITDLFKANPVELQRLTTRLRMSVVSWSWLSRELTFIEQTLSPAIAGDQTLLRLLSGFRRQIQSHSGTGIIRPDTMAEEVALVSSIRKEEHQS